MTATPTRELDSTPNLTVLFGKAVLTGFTRHGSALPSTVYSRSPLAVDPGHLSAYNKVCGFRLTDQLPITYPHVLGFPLQVKLMTDNDFPFPLVGSVHIANRITQLRPLHTTDVLRVQVHVENLRDHAKGRQFDMVTTVFAGDSVTWHSTSTYLRRTGSGGSSADKDVVVRQPGAVWSVPDDIGRRYAEVAGDRNPIHLHPLAAKLFGFPRAIAHGMWTKARCLAAFEGRLPEAYTVDVKFKLPVLLPAKAGFTTDRADDGWSFELFNARNGKPHLTGEITSA
ncbi:MaoC/PaaZ C-terminal domain-containing protein [Kibdelosporangium persicum]|uniref:Bifunctional enoyl-CoA hydratase/phosphate acetyltransferase n=1 Tax=Kibdelosporangium persicum TaxID=2698649 RepID=A0ABX2EXX7_9PSEU|nr:MaoC/PaaZ C-terminal domain-containing protein [Kibdelosporangium persicum]NRN63893.1 Bifunctional enoyl-CoA hydratase/phosphate acetyltransferase [Kibdelosporangium persicum]